MTCENCKFLSFGWCCYEPEKIERDGLDAACKYFEVRKGESKCE